MKKLLYFFIFVTVVALASCAKDDVVMPDIEGDTMVSFEVNAIGDETSPQAMRAYNDGLKVRDLEYAIYKKESDETYKFIKNVSIDNFFAEGKQSGTFKVQLGYGKTYVIMLWADCTGDNYTVTWDENDINACKVAITNTDALVSQDDSADAFFAKVEVLVSDAAPAPINMARPFAQINVCTDDYADAVTRGFTATQTSMKVNAYTSLNLFSGEVGDKEEVTFALAALPTGEDATLDGFKRIAMNYVFAPVAAADEADNEKVNITFYANSDLNSLTWENIGIARNQRTNICGSLLSENDWEVYNRIIDINVMQFNVMNTTDAWAELAQLVKAEEIDIFCGQEFGFDKNGNVHRMFNNFRNHLGTADYGDNTKGTIIFHERSDDKERTAIFYRQSKFDLVDHGHYWYYEEDATQEKKTEIEWLGVTYRAHYVRFAIWAILREKTTGIEFFVTTTHLDYFSDPIPGHWADYPIQWNQGEWLKNNSNVLAKYDGTETRRSIIATGDMNCNYTTDPIKNLINKGYADTYDLTTNHSSPDNSRNTMNELSGSKYVQVPDKCLDYIFTSGDEECKLEVLSHTVHPAVYNGKRMSDHNAVSVQLKYTYPPKHQ